MERTRGNKYKLHHERFHLDVRNRYFFFYSENNQSLEHLHRDVVKCPSLLVFKTQLDRGSDHLWGFFPAKVVPDDLLTSLPTWVVL